MIILKTDKMQTFIQILKNIENGNMGMAEAIALTVVMVVILGSSLLFKQGKSK